MSKFTKTLIQYSTLLDATVGQSESDLIEEEKHKLELQQNCLVQKNQLKDLRERLGDAYDRINDLQKNKEPHFLLLERKSLTLVVGELEETAKGIRDAIHWKLNNLKLVLGRLRQVLSRDFTDDTEALLFIPEEDEIDITKLENGLALTDTCATVQRFHCLFKDDEHVAVVVFVGYCWNHITNQLRVYTCYYELDRCCSLVFN